LPQRWLYRLQPDIVRSITEQTSGLLALTDHPVALQR
jgi:hypothetical protein